MPYLALLILNGMVAAVSFAASFIGKKLAVGGTLAAFLVAGWIALQVSVYALWTGLGFVVPSAITDALAVVLYLLPPNTFACLNAYVVARIARWLWNQQRQHAVALAAA